MGSVRIVGECGFPSVPAAVADLQAREPTIDANYRLSSEWTADRFLSRLRVRMWQSAGFRPGNGQTLNGGTIKVL